MMKVIVQSLDEVPEAHREHYAFDEKLGAFALELEEVDRHPVVGDLKAQFERDKASLKRRKDTVAAVRKIDADIAALERRRQELAAVKKIDADVAALKRRRQELVDAETTEDADGE